MLDGHGYTPWHARSRTSSAATGPGRFRQDHRRHQQGHRRGDRHRAPEAGRAETERAIAAAAGGVPGIPRHGPDGPLSRCCGSLHDALMDNQRRRWRELLTVEMGKPLAEAKGEIAIGAQYVRWFAEEARRAKGEIVPAGVNGRRILVTKHAIGVVGMITPWNFPSSMLARKIAPALAAGCTVVAKPATADALFRPRLGRALRGGRVFRGRGQRRDRLGARDRGRDDGQRGGSQDHLHRLHRGRQGADPPAAPTRSRRSRWSWAATRPSSSSTMPIWTRRSRARWCRSSAMRARPASAPTASTCRRASMTPSSRS